MTQSPGHRTVASSPTRRGAPGAPALNYTGREG